MALFDFLKRKKEVQKAKDKKVAEVSVKPEEAKKTTSDFAPSKRKTAKGFSYNIIKEPHISEKATNLSEENKYIFKVYDNVNKLEIKKSVEGIYGVDVLSVNIIKIPSKKRRIGGREGFKKGYRKAIVTIKEGQKIEMF